MSEALAAFAEEYNRCWVCGTMAIHTFPPRLEIHHIVRGADRAKAKDDRRVFIRTCQRCHQDRLDGMPLVTQYALKALHDPANFDRVGLNTLRGRAENAISEEEVVDEITRLRAASAETGFPFPRHVFGG